MMKMARALVYVKQIIEDGGIENECEVKVGNFP